LAIDGPDRIIPQAPWEAEQLWERLAELRVLMDKAYEAAFQQGLGPAASQGYLTLSRAAFSAYGSGSRALEIYNLLKQDDGTLPEKALRDYVLRRSSPWLLPPDPDPGAVADATALFIPQTYALIAGEVVQSTIEDYLPRTDGAQSLLQTTELAKLLLGSKSAIFSKILESTAAKGTEATYEIVDGVRRSTAAYSSGVTTIPAQVMVDGKIVQTLDVPLSALYSPKSVIDVSTPSSLLRWQQTLQKTQAGSTPPPIIIQQGSRGTPIPNIRFDYLGEGW
jgi:hypothetical protein